MDRLNQILEHLKQQKLMLKRFQNENSF
jgi:hypothetical protein